MSLTLEANALECVRGGRRLFHDLSFSIASGELLEISGPNGSGKTSLLRILCGLLAPSAGEIRWNHADVAATKEEYLARLAYLGHTNGVKVELSATENLRVACGMAGVPRDGAVIESALHRMGLAGYELPPAKILSQGQQRRLALARLLVVQRSLWILDEPLAALDESAIRLVQSVLEQHLSDGGMAVLTTHQPLDVKAGKTKQIRLESPSGH